MSKTFIIGHRGSPVECPENTLASFRRTLEVGGDGVELDIRKSSGGQLVVMHDPTLQRTTNGEGAVEDRTLAELKGLDAGSWFGEEYRGLEIPTFREALRLMRGRGLVCVELKVPGIAQQVAHEIEEEGMHDYCIITGCRKFLSEVRKGCPHLPTLLAASWEDSLERAQREIEERICWAVTMGIRLLAISIYTLTEEIVEACCRRGVTVWGTRARDPSDEEIRSFLSLGLEGLITDVPGRVVQVVRQLNKTA